MFSFSSLIAACLLGAAAVSATPLARGYGTCSPNFEGTPISIVSGGRDWGAYPLQDSTILSAFVNSKWHVEQAGSSAATYIVKALTPDNGLVVDVDQGVLELKPIDSLKMTQIFEIDCTFCFSGASSAHSNFEPAVGCTIKNTGSADDICVQLHHDTGLLALNVCNGSADQIFNFFT
ncbi:hypothetical protein B0H13DRAFT_2353822 [Mycena leptocephala]|nr:hypothetical protein B0H13DRAFT_2353822 [Mycena leptocephala]